MITVIITIAIIITYSDKKLIQRHALLPFSSTSPDETDVPSRNSEHLARRRKCGDGERNCLHLSTDRDWLASSSVVRSLQGRIGSCPSGPPTHVPNRTARSGHLDRKLLLDFGHDIFIILICGEFQQAVRSLQRERFYNYCNFPTECM